MTAQDLPPRRGIAPRSGPGPAMSRAGCALAICAGLLAGCDRDPCRSPAERELRTIETLITETQADLARGYTEARRGPDAGLNLCLGNGMRNVGISMCSQHDLGTSYAVPIDADSKRAQLAQLEAKRDALTSQARSDRMVCQATRTP